MTDFKNHVYNTFVEKFPNYKKTQVKIINIIKNYSESDAEYVKKELNNECFQFLILGIIDRLYYDDHIIEKDVYDEIHKLIVQMSKFNYFNFYHKMLNSNLEDVDVNKIIKELTEMI